MLALAEVFKICIPPPQCLTRDSWSAAILCKDSGRHRRPTPAILEVSATRERGPCVSQTAWHCLLLITSPNSEGDSAPTTFPGISYRSFAHSWNGMWMWQKGIYHRSTIVIQPLLTGLQNLPLLDEFSVIIVVQHNLGTWPIGQRIHPVPHSVLLSHGMAAKYPTCQARPGFPPTSGTRPTVALLLSSSD